MKINFVAFLPFPANELFLPFRVALIQHLLLFEAFSTTYKLFETNEIDAGCSYACCRSPTMGWLIVVVVLLQKQTAANNLKNKPTAKLQIYSGTILMMKLLMY